MQQPADGNAPVGANGGMKLQLPILDLSVDRYAAFKLWKERWEDYVLLTDISTKEQKVQAAMLRYAFSSDTRKIYNSLTLTAAQKENPNEIIEELERFAKGIINETLERHQFNNRQQEEGETFDNYLTELKILSTNCAFCDRCFPGLLRDRIVGGINSDVVRKYLLAEKDLTLEKTVEKCRSYEVAEQGMEALSKDKAVNKVGAFSNRDRREPFRDRRESSNNLTPCKFCMKKHNWGRKFCPAWEKKCHKCKKENHFSGSVFCNEKEANAVQEGDWELQDEVGALFLGSVEEDQNGLVVDCVQKNFELKVNAPGGSVKFKVDTGADVTVIGKEHLIKFGKEIEELKPTKKSLKGPNNAKINCHGFFTTRIKFKEKSAMVTCYVCEGVKIPLLGRPEIINLEIVQLNINGVAEGERKETKVEIPREVKKFPEVFTGLGKLKGDPVKIVLKEDGKPYHLSTPRRVSIPYLKRLEAELKNMEDIGVIKKIHEPTEWCHPIVVVPKAHSEKIRICLDLTKLNVNVKRELHQLPSVDETVGKIGTKGKWFAKLDANHGYWQIPLEEKSQKLCTFITPFGRYCPTRGPFGLTSMPEIFSKKMDRLIEGLSWVVKSMDDFLIFAETEEELQKNVDEILGIMKENGMTLNVNKCIFKAKEVEFLGYKISEKGIYPVEEKLQAIKQFKVPENVSELRSFLGMAQQLTKFSPELAERSEPLRGLLSSKNMWLWTVEHTESFEAVKKILCEPPTLAIYDVNKKTKIRTDGSKLNGISVILLQLEEDTWKPVDCRSRYLTETEKGYAPIEIEMLAVSWGISRMSLYLMGLPEFMVETDHKPLVPILNSKSLIEMSPRIQRLRMGILQYSFIARYVPGKDLLDADSLSRAPVSIPTKEDEAAEQELDVYVNQVIQGLPATERRLEEIRRAVRDDDEMQTLVKMVEKGWTKLRYKCNERIRGYWKYQDEITYIDGLLLKGDKIIIPKRLRREILSAIHTGHLGMDKCKGRARQSVYWLGINSDIENLISSCRLCIELQASKAKEPMLIRELPTRPWETVGSDLFSWAGKHYIIITDYYSGYPEVYLLKTEEAENVILATKDAFARHGVPTKVVSDNGPQFAGSKYRKFANEWQFDHNTSSPYYPQSNGLAESSVKSVKRVLKKCNRDSQEFQKGLLILRNSPLKNGKSPAQMLYGRQLRDNLPTLPIKFEASEAVKRDLVGERDDAKRYYDKHVPKSTKVDVFQEKQRVVIQNEKTKEWSLRGSIIREVAPRSYLVKMDKGGELRRNRRFIRKLYCITLQSIRDREEMLAEEELDVSRDTIPYDEELEDSLEVSRDTIPYDEEVEEGLLNELEDVIHDGVEVLDVEHVIHDGVEVSEERREQVINRTVSSKGRVIKVKKVLDYEDL